MNFQIDCKNNKICGTDHFKLLLSAFTSILALVAIEFLTGIFEISTVRYI